MKVLILSTYSNAGGAAIAADRLLHALRKNGVEATMLCRKNLTWLKRRKPQSWTSIIERLIILVASGFNRKDLWATDIAYLGQDITNTREYQEADVIHLHWVNQGFISLSQVNRFLRDGKRVVWTMHDAWNAMGAYHLKIQQKDTWLERWTYSRKERLYQSKKILFVTCSKWLRNEVLASPLMAGQNVTAIPNPIDAELFHPMDNKAELRRSFGLPEHEQLVLFVAQDVNNINKGVQYLAAMEEKIRQQDTQPFRLIALGRDLPYIHDTKRMAELYACVDAFVLPSLSENLPNTIMEAMACGTPCIGFNTGGIPEMIDHRKNGYVARYKDADDLKEGILFVLNNKDSLGKEARGKVLQWYSESTISELYKGIYD